MSIIRVSHNKENPYVLLNKKFLEGSILSLRAKGLLAYLLSKPDNWTVRVSHLVREMKEGRDAIQVTLKELEAQGYLVRSRTKDEKGKFRGWETIVFETPQQSNLIRFPENPSDGLPVNRFSRPTVLPPLINNEKPSNDKPINEIKEKKAAKLTKRKDKELLQTWFDLARNKRIVAAQVNQELVVTGTEYELGPGCTRSILELMQEYPLERLQKAAHAAK